MNKIFNIFTKIDKNNDNQCSFTGKDGRDYGSFEALIAADERYKKYFYQFKALDGSDAIDYETLQFKNLTYLISQGFEYILIKIFRDFPHLNETYFKALIQTFDGRDEQKNLLKFYLKKFIGLVSPLDSLNFLLRARVFFEKYSCWR